MIARFTALLFAATLTLSAAEAQTAGATLLGEFRDWSAFTVPAQGGGKICFAYAQPQKAEPQGVNRDPIHFFVTHRPGEGVKNEINVITGYPYQNGSTATATVGNDSFMMFTKDDGAWVQNSGDEDRLIDAMRRGRDLIVKGTSQRGTQTTDTYSLLGITAALDRIEQECSR